MCFGPTGGRRNDRHRRGHGLCWYEYLLGRGSLDEVNFWRPSAHQAFRGEPFSPFLFKLKSPHKAICGFGLFAKYSALPNWLAWDAFGTRNGSESREAMLASISKTRRGIDFTGAASVEQIGCILLSRPVFFPREAWIPQPEDWPPQNLTNKRYDLSQGEGKRVRDACLRNAEVLQAEEPGIPSVAEQPRHGQEYLARQRLGQGTFRVAVMDSSMGADVRSPRSTRCRLWKRPTSSPFRRMGPASPATASC